MEATESPGFLKRLFLNPLALRELRVACRSWKLVIILSAYLLIQGSIFAIWLFVQNENGIYDDPTSIGRGLFITMSIVLVIVVMLVFPAFSSTAIASEHEKKSFDLLLLTPLSPWEIASGKFFAAGLQASIFIIATIPLFAVANLFGGIEPGAFFTVLWVMILFSVFISFVGVYASSLVKKSIPAVLVTYLFAFLIGIVLLVLFMTISFAVALLAGFAPALIHILDPTLGEGVYYITFLTLTCALYCSFLFLSTTNRLKPTSHNKSTGLRLLWTVAAILIPLQIGVYFLVIRVVSASASISALLLGTLYFGLVMLVPALTSPAEAPMPSRRVRREMTRYPQGLLSGGGKLFFPGGARGTAHAALTTTLGMLLMVGVGFICTSQVKTELDDRGALAKEYTTLMSGGADPLTSPVGAMKFSVALRTAPPDEMRETVTTYLSHELNGQIVFIAVLLMTLLAVSQISWRMTLSGLSKTIAGILAGLVLLVWLAVPFIIQQIGDGSAAPRDAIYAQFSPIHACFSGVLWGEESGKAAVLQGVAVSRHLESANALQWRWMTYLISAGMIAGGLLAWNVVSHRKVLAKLKTLTGDDGQHVPQPVQTTQAQVEHAIAAVTAPEALPPGQMPPSPGEDFDDIANAAAEQTGASQPKPEEK